MSLTERDRKRLEGVHPDLVRVVETAATIQVHDKVTFIVTEGLRTKEKQMALCKAGASQTMNSRHLTGHAVDLAAVVDGEVRWDWPLYNTLARAMKAAAVFCEVPLIWGGDWKTFKDGPHFELLHAKYPA